MDRRWRGRSHLARWSRDGRDRKQAESPHLALTAHFVRRRSKLRRAPPRSQAPSGEPRSLAVLAHEDAGRRSCSALRACAGCDFRGPVRPPASRDRQGPGSPHLWALSGSEAGLRIRAQRQSRRSGWRALARVARPERSERPSPRASKRGNGVTERRARDEHRSEALASEERNRLGRLEVRSWAWWTDSMEILL